MMSILGSLEYWRESQGNSRPNLEISLRSMLSTKVTLTGLQRIILKQLPVSKQFKLLLRMMNICRLKLSAIYAWGKIILLWSVRNSTKLEEISSRCIIQWSLKRQQASLKKILRNTYLNLKSLMLALSTRTKTFRICTTHQWKVMTKFIEKSTWLEKMWKKDRSS